MKVLIEFVRKDVVIFSIGVFFITIGFILTLFNVGTGYAFSFPNGFLISTLLSFTAIGAGIILISFVKMGVGFDE